MFEEFMFVSVELNFSFLCAKFEETHLAIFLSKWGGGGGILHVLRKLFKCFW